MCARLLTCCWKEVKNNNVGLKSLKSSIMDRLVFACSGKGRDGSDSGSIGSIGSNGRSSC